MLRHLVRRCFALKEWGCFCLSRYNQGNPVSSSIIWSDHTYIHTHTHIHTHTYIYTHTHTRTYTYIHTYIHTFFSSRGQWRLRFISSTNNFVSNYFTARLTDMVVDDFLKVCDNGWFTEQCTFWYKRRFESWLLLYPLSQGSRVRACLGFGTRVAERFVLRLAMRRSLAVMGGLVVKPKRLTASLYGVNNTLLLNKKITNTMSWMLEAASRSELP
jgi:hypothetical protein